MIAREVWLPSLTARRRWAIAVTLAVTALAAVPFELVASRNERGYVHLMPFGRPTVVAAVLTAVPVALGLAGWLVVRSKVTARVIIAVTAVLSVVMCYAGWQFSTWATIFGDRPSRAPTVVAVSSDRSLEIVFLHYSVFLSSVDVVRIRSRSGLASREAKQDLACFDWENAEETFGSARFLSDHEVEVRTDEGTLWTTTFDPDTLLAQRTVSYGCNG
jgi:hypothetical protein